MYRLSTPGRAGAIAAAGCLAMAACQQTRDVVAPIAPPTAVNSIFQSYVALGNSITAGFQSNGINDSTQRQSYARLLATAMNTTYRYPSLGMPGCPPPIANPLTGALVGGPAAPACSGRRFNTDTSEVLTNVAVPGARVLDPVSVSTGASNVLTDIILRGGTQVSQALRAKPTFASIWIGNNDVLVAGLSGIVTPTPGLGQGIISSQAQFQASYDQMVGQLLAGAPGLKGVMIAVAKVQYLPSLVSGALIAANPTIAPSTRISDVLKAAAGTPVSVLPNCTGSASLVNVPLLIQAIRAYVADPRAPGAHPPVISCDPSSSAPYPPPIGNIYVLDAGEQSTLNSAIDGYNGYIAAKAAAVGFAFYDPNPLFAARRADGSIPPFPNFGSSTATFGNLISLDGVHPSGAAHAQLAAGIAAAINARYGTALVP